jgi:REP-associated tyrosine transposase
LSLQQPDLNSEGLNRNKILPYWNCYYHLVWATKYRRPLLNAQITPFVYRAIEQKSVELHSPILAMNSVNDHIHVAVCIAPSVSISTWIGHIKGLSAHSVNAVFANLESTFKWQEGYGVVTFGEKNLAYVQDYIANQQVHHAAGKIVDKLERIDSDD